MPTTVLDPFAFLTALARPLTYARGACVRFVTGTGTGTASPLRDAKTAGVNDTRENVEPEASVTERSFANELASLLGSTPLRPGSDSNADHDRVASIPSGTPTSANVRDASPEALVRDAPTPSADGYGFITDTEPETDEHHIVLRSNSSLAERAVPLTRLPLRAQESAITWIAVAGLEPVPSRTQRHAILERCVRDASALPGTILERAYREEDLEGRTIALRALARHHPADAREIFVEALRLGSDEERALAIDGLTGIGARAELLPAFGDRVDAIAAKAALAYVGSRSRIEYRTELAPYVDAAQVDTILTLLAGIIE